MEHLLSQAAADLTIRSEVESTLRSVLHDVEQAYTLEQALRNHNALEHYQEQLGALKVRYEEREVLWEEERMEKERLGMLLMEEIVKLSAHELKEEKLKREMEVKIQQLEVEKDDLLQKQKQQLASAKAELEAETSTSSDARIEVTKKESEVPTPTHANAAASETKSSTIILESQEAHASSTQVEEPQQEQVVKIVETEPVISPVSEILTSMEDSALMTIFAFLDPVEIMNLAQMNKNMYSKVNMMFGQPTEISVESSNVTDSADGTTMASSQSNENEVAAATAASPSGDDFPIEVINNLKALGFQESEVKSCLRASNGNPNVAAEYLMNGIPSGVSTPKSSPALVGMTGPGHKRQNSGTSVATAGTAGTTGSGGANPFSQMSSWFASTETSSSASAAPTTASASTTTSMDSGSEIKLNAAMASSMASKLTPTEL